MSGEWQSGNIFIRPAMNFVKAGEVMSGHKHNFDHTTIIFSGAVHVRATSPNGVVEEAEFIAPAHFLVRAEVMHEITAIRDDTTIWCVYSHRTPQGEVVQQYNGFTRGYE